MKKQQKNLKNKKTHHFQREIVSFSVRSQRDGSESAAISQKNPGTKGQITQ
jgi:hypothetical protein